MANSDFYNLVQPGKYNGGNAHTANLIDSDTLPWAFAPALVFSQVITWKDLRDATGVLQTDEVQVGGTIVAGSHDLVFTNARTGAAITTISYVVHEDTVTIGGTASDGNYDVIFDALDPPVRARVVRSTTPATNADIAAAMSDVIDDLIATELAGVVASVSATDEVVTIVYEADIAAQTLTTAETTATGTIVASVADDADAVAAGLEALIEAARGVDEPLEDYVDDESVATDTITIEYLEGVQISLAVDFPGTSTGTITVVNVATIPIGTTGDLFPANVIVNDEGGAGQNVITAFAGITTITATLGDAGAVDGLMTSTTIDTTGFTSTIAAAEYAGHMELAYEPIVTITADEPFANLTAGEVEVLIPYLPPPTI